MLVIHKTHNNSKWWNDRYSDTDWQLWQELYIFCTQLPWWYRTIHKLLQPKPFWSDTHSTQTGLFIEQHFQYLWLHTTEWYYVWKQQVANDVEGSSYGLTSYHISICLQRVSDATLKKLTLHSILRTKNYLRMSDTRSCSGAQVQHSVWDLY